MLPVKLTRVFISTPPTRNVAMVTPILQSQLRSFSKVTLRDRGRNKPRTSPKDKAFRKIADEGRKLAVSDSEYIRTSRNALLEQKDDFINPSQDIDSTFLDDALPGDKPYVRRPLVEEPAASNLFVPLPKPSELKVVKKSLFEKHAEFSSEYMNNLLYRNPYKEMKTDPYDLSYPIDNQDGQEAEKGVSFAEHVLLDDLYKDFPTSGPIRNFIELVITGLSQNPFLSPEEKREHVAWFKEEIDTLTPDDIKKMDTYYEQLIAKKARKKSKILH